MIDYKKELNEEQYEAVRTTEGPVLILAVAGAGKTRTLIYRMAYLIEHGADPERILMLTFTNKAADEMKSRAEGMIGGAARKITACTYHSFCLRMLRSYGKKIGIDPDFTILSSSDIPDVIDIVKNKFGIDYTEFPRSSVVASIISASVNTGESIDSLMAKPKGRYQKFETFIPEVKHIAEGYKAYKKEHEVMDFDDLLTEYIRLLKESPETRDHIDSYFQYIMVDEYQDSNHLQDEILMLMRQNNRNLAVVGDDMQSLYGFRGADVGNILTFGARYKGTKTITLFKNYRSGQEILDFSNDIVKNHLENGIFKEMQGNHRSGIIPKIVAATTKFSESFYIINDIRKKLTSGIRPQDIAILVRNTYASNNIEMMLTQERIPYVKYGGTKFMDRDYVKNMAALWKCMSNERDEISWYRILRLFPGIADKYSQYISEEAGERGADILLHNAFETYKFAPDLKAFYAVYENLKRCRFPDVIKKSIKWYKSIREKGIAAERKSPAIKTREKTELDKQIISLLVFCDIAKSYKNLSSFVEGILLDPPEQSDEGKAIVLSTIHSAKGLEWPVVYVAGCAEGKFPRYSDTDEEDIRKKELAEELRCMYVAVTRAKDCLTVTFPQTETTKFGVPKTNHMSQFLCGTEKTCEQVSYPPAEDNRLPVA